MFLKNCKVGGKCIGSDLKLQVRQPTEGGGKYIRLALRLPVQRPSERWVNVLG